MDIYVRVTDILDYIFCPRKVYLKRVLGYEEEKKEATLIGSIVHEVFDLINSKEEELVYEIDDDYPFDYILSLYEKFLENTIHSTINKFEDEIKKFNFNKEELFSLIWNHTYNDILERAKNVYNTLKLTNEYGIFLWDKLEPKIKSELELISDSLQLVGRIDKLEIYKDFVVPVEIKSGKPSFSHIYQLHAYALLLKYNFPRYSIEKGILYYTSRNIKKEVKFSTKYFQRVLDYRDKILEIIENEKDPGINLNPSKCFKCPLYSICKQLKVKNNK